MTLRKQPDAHRYVSLLQHTSKSVFEEEEAEENVSVAWEGDMWGPRGLLGQPANLQLIILGFPFNGSRMYGCTSCKYLHPPAWLLEQLPPLLSVGSYTVPLPRGST